MVNSTAPTAAQIAQVEANLKALQALNDYVYNHSDALVLHAYLLMSEKDEDPGIALGINLFEGVLWAFCSFFGEIGNFAAGFLGGMMTTWAADPPPNINTTFANTLQRLEATSIAVDKQFAIFYQDPVSNWNTSYTFQGVTGTLGDLASISLPTETDPHFEDVATAGLNALDHSLWASVLRTNFLISKFIPTIGNPGENSPNPFYLPGPQDAFPANLADEYIKQYPSYYLVPTGWFPGSGTNAVDRWICQPYNIGTGVTGVSDGALARDACAYLFKNYYTDTVVNPDALYDRATVFNSLNINTYPIPYDWGAGAQENVSTKYKRAMVEGTTLGALAAKDGRAGIEARIIKKAHDDHAFAMHLKLNPRETLEDFLGVAIPETVRLDITIETDNVLALVVPRKELPLANYGQPTEECGSGD